jgi:hypothetical protein
MAPDVIQIVDTYPHETEGHRRTLKNDPDREAEGLSNLAKLLGRKPRKIAIVSREDEPRLLAYQREDYEIIKINGDRDTELRRFIREMTVQIKRDTPKHTVLVSHDPEFVFLCEAAAPHTDLAVWAESGAVPRELAEGHYNFRPLEELLPFLKIPRVDVRLDLENIAIGLLQRGWVPNVPALISAIRHSLSDLGEIVRITAYADWTELGRNHGGPNVNWQRDLTLAGGESRYVVNQRGKNTADMLIADDIRSLVELNPSSSGAIDVIVLATMDRDFRPIVETAQRKGKRVVVLGLEQSISRELEAAASEVRFLDKHLVMQPTGAGNQPTAKHEDVSLMLKVAAWMHQKRWRRAYRDQLDQEFSYAAEPLDKLITDGWLVPTPDSRVDRQGRARSLEFNRDKPSAQAAYYLARWIPERIHYCLKHMAYVDTHFLATGMNNDRTLGQLGIAQSRVAAENWLNAAANAGIVVASEQSHPKAPEKQITVWTLPNTNSDAPSEPIVGTGAADEPAVATPATVADDVAVAEEVTLVNATNLTAETVVGANVVHMITPAQASIASNHLRHVLTNGLSDSELTTITFDHFRDVHRKFAGAPKVDRIQALLEYVELRNQQNGLLAAIREVNPALVDRPEVKLLAA